LRQGRRDGDGSGSEAPHEPTDDAVRDLLAVREDRRLPRPRSSAMKHVRQFGGGSSEGRAKDKALLGGKGANLAEMASLGLPVPPGFTITTEVCRYVMEHGAGGDPAGRSEFDPLRFGPEHLADEVKQALDRVEQLTKH